MFADKVVEICTGLLKYLILIIYFFFNVAYSKWELPKQLPFPNISAQKSWPHVEKNGYRVLLESISEN